MHCSGLVWCFEMFYSSTCCALLSSILFCSILFSVLLSVLFCFVLYCCVPPAGYMRTGSSYKYRVVRGAVAGLGEVRSHDDGVCPAFSQPSHSLLTAFSQPSLAVNLLTHCPFINSPSKAITLHILFIHLSVHFLIKTLYIEHLCIYVFCANVMSLQGR